MNDFGQQITPTHHQHDALLVELWRGQVLESVHRVHAVLVDRYGQSVCHWGNPRLLTTARSALKPFQLWSGLHAGILDHFSLDQEDLAFMMASHSGESYHTEHCLRLLDKLGRSSDELACGAHLPYHIPSAHDLLRSGRQAETIHNNCSGKHCGMLAAQAVLSDRLDYLSIDHPVQIRIFESIQTLLGISREFAWGIDGCSLPTPALYLNELAHLFAQLATGVLRQEQTPDPFLDRIYQAMTTHPELVAGSNRFDTVMMKETYPYLGCKVGGEAIRGFALRPQSGEFFGLAVKVEDGAMRALHPACIALLQQLTFLPEKLSKPLQDLFEGRESNWAGRQATRFRIG